MRTVGYDVPADWTQYESDAAATATATAAAGDAAEEAVDAAASMKKHASGCSCGHGATHNHTAKQQQQQLSAAAQAVAAAKIGLSPERLQSLQQLLQDIAQQRRVVGYNVPALDQQQLFLEQFAMQQQQQQQSGASTAAAAAAATLVGVPPARSASRLQEDSRLYARKYFKSPCNNPEARQLFKNSKNHPLDRSYYKNPANAPLLVQEMPQQPPQVRSCAGCSMLQPMALHSHVLSFQIQEINKAHTYHSALQELGPQRDSDRLIDSAKSCICAACGHSSITSSTQHTPNAMAK
jgi:hypothetical protein